MAHEITAVNCPTCRQPVQRRGRVLDPHKTGDGTKCRASDRTEAEAVLLHVADVRGVSAT